MSSNTLKNSIPGGRAVVTRFVSLRGSLLSTSLRPGKNGLPIYVYRIGSLESVEKELSADPPERRYQRMYVPKENKKFPSHINFAFPHFDSIVLSEFMTRFYFQLCTALPRPSSATPVSSATNIIDLEGVSFGTMWRLRNHLQDASHLAKANYPETISTIAVVNAPSFFPIVWGWIKVRFILRIQVFVFLSSLLILCF